MLLKLAIGLAGIGFIVVLHELGHLIAACATGITVEIFSLGMGPRVAHWQIGETEVRISLLPIGGYCRMKGADDLARAITQKSATFDNVEDGSLFAVSPTKRAIVYSAGPLFNFLASALIFSYLGALPVPSASTPSRIATVNQYPELFSPSSSSAYDAGLRTGDLVIRFDNQEITDWQQLEQLLLGADKEIHAFTIIREGKELVVNAQSDRDGRWGITGIVEPVVGHVTAQSAESLAGLKEGDRIIMACGYPVQNNLDLMLALKEATTIRLEVVHGGRHEKIMFPKADDGIYHFSLDHGYTTKPGKFSLLWGMKMASRQAGEMASKIFSLVKGNRRNLTRELSGMGQAAMMIGTITLDGIERHVDVGFKGFWYLMAIVSLSLAITNLLPIPAFDGSQIALSFWEMASRRRISPRTWWTIQLIGWFGVGLLMLLLSFAH